MLAMAETKIVETFADLDVDRLYAVFDKLRTLMSFNLGSWAANNQDRFE